jgi:ribosome-associated protein
VTSTALAKSIAALTLTKKAQDVLLLDMRGLTSMADFFVVCSADSDVQVRAIADAVDEGLGEEGVDPWHKETGSPNWMLLDYVDVVVHVFHKNARAFYALEKLWGDAKITSVTDEPKPARAVGTKKKTPVRKVAARKPAAKKPAAKKPATRKAAAKKPATSPKVKRTRSAS